jgi:hypothetical protein
MEDKRTVSGMTPVSSHSNELGVISVSTYSRISRCSFRCRSVMLGWPVDALCHGGSANGTGDVIVVVIPDTVGQYTRKIQCFS